MAKEELIDQLLRRNAELETEAWLLRRELHKEYPAISSELALPRREAQVLGLLIERAPLWVSKAQFVSRMYGLDDFEVSEEVVESHVSKLKTKLEKSVGVVIRAERFFGYALAKVDAVYLKGIVGGVRLIKERV